MTLDELFTHTRALPSVPKVVRELAVALGRDGAQESEVARRLGTDQVLSATALRMANSAYYNVSRRVGTVDEAVKLLGFRAVRSIVLSVGMATAFRELGGLDLREHWRFSVHTAAAARAIAERLAGSVQLLPAEAFTAGLLLGIGRLIMQVGMPEAMQQLPPELSPFPSPERASAERRAFGYSFAEVGAELARRWHFPPEFPAVLRCSAELEDDAAPLSVVVHVGARLALADEERQDRAFIAEQLPEPAVRFFRTCGVKPAIFLFTIPAIDELSRGVDDLIQGEK